MALAEILMGALRLTSPDTQIGLAAINFATQGVSLVSETAGACKLSVEGSIQTGQWLIHSGDKGGALRQPLIRSNAAALKVSCKPLKNFQGGTLSLHSYPKRQVCYPSIAVRT